MWRFDGRMIGPRRVLWYATGTAVCLLACAIPQALRAQNPARMSLDVTGGFSTVRGGGYRYWNDGGISLDLLLAVRRPAMRGFLWAASTGGRLDAGQNCAFDVISRSCLPNAPTVGHLGALAGYEVRRGGSAVRALVGPSFFGVPSGNRAGVRAQLSAAVGARHIALTGGISGNVIAPFNGSSLRYVAGAFGVRVQ
jgi:hypothetical protein